MVLEADNIELYFDSKRILYGIYVKAESGKITGLIGRNGSGKSSLLKIMFGSLQPKHKSIRVNGNFQKRPLYKTNNVAYLPQHQFLPNGLTVRSAFKLFEVDFHSLTELFPSFKKQLSNTIKEISTGERKLIETYLILNCKKKILLLDEPFSFVAPLYVDRLKQLLLSKKKEKTIIVTDHHYQQIMDISDNLYFLKNGCSKNISSIEDLVNEGYLLNQ